MLLTAYLMATGLAAVAAAAVMAYCHFARAPDDPLYVSAGFAVWFVVSTMAWSVFNLQDAALTGMRSAVWVPLENGLYGLVKLVLLVVVARTSLFDGVFASWTIPVIALLVPVNLLLFRRILPRHATRGARRSSARRAALRRYMAGDYAAQVFTQLSSTFLPVLVVSLLGAAQGAVLPARPDRVRRDGHAGHGDHVVAGGRGGDGPPTPPARAGRAAADLRAGAARSGRRARGAVVLELFGAQYRAGPRRCCS